MVFGWNEVQSKKLTMLGNTHRLHACTDTLAWHALHSVRRVSVKTVIRLCYIYIAYIFIYIHIFGTRAAPL